MTRTGLIALILSWPFLIWGSTDMSAHAQGSLDGPWVRAIESGEVENVTRVLQSGGDIEERLYMEKTPAIYAAGSDGWDIVLVLLQRGANPAAVDHQGFSIATFAETSRVAPDNKFGRALAEVKKILKAKGLM